LTGIKSQCGCKSNSQCYIKLNISQPTKNTKQPDDTEPKRERKYLRRQGEKAEDQRKLLKIERKPLAMEKQRQISSQVHEE